MDNLTLFVAGLVVAIPTFIVVTALVFAAGADDREEELKRRNAGTATVSVGER